MFWYRFTGAVAVHAELPLLHWRRPKKPSDAERGGRNLDFPSTNVCFVVVAGSPVGPHTSRGATCRNPPARSPWRSAQVKAFGQFDQVVPP